MTRGRWIATALIVVAALAAVTAAGLLGFAGVERTVAAGSQARICGANVGVSVVEPGASVKLLGVSNAVLHAGDRARVHALCVVEVVSVSGAEVATDAAQSEDDSAVGGVADGGARVTLRWRLW